MINKTSINYLANLLHSKHANAVRLVSKCNYCGAPATVEIIDPYQVALLCSDCYAQVIAEVEKLKLPKPL